MFFLINASFFRSSHPEVLSKKAVLKNLAKFTESICASVLFLTKLQASGFWKCAMAQVLRTLNSKPMGDSMNDLGIIHLVRTQNFPKN